MHQAVFFYPIIVVSNFSLLKVVIDGELVDDQLSLFYLKSRFWLWLVLVDTERFTVFVFRVSVSWFYSMLVFMFVLFALNSWFMSFEFELRFSLFVFDLWYMIGVLVRTLRCLYRFELGSLSVRVWTWQLYRCSCWLWIWSNICWEIVILFFRTSHWNLISKKPP